MKKILHITILLVASASLLNAQSIEKNVIAAGGSSYSSGNCKIEFTVGETFINTLSQGNKSITQGFHQPNLTVTRMANVEEGDSVMTDETAQVREGEILKTTLSVDVFPNPTTDYLNVQQHADALVNLNVTVTNMQGQLVMQVKMTNAQLQLDFTQLKAGTYILIVQNEAGDVSNTYRVVKAN